MGYIKEYVTTEEYNAIRKKLDEQEKINLKLIDENNDLHKNVLEIYMDNASLKRENDKLSEQLEKAVLVSGSN